MITMQGVHSSEVPLVWPRVLEHLQMALDRSENLALDEVRRKLLATEMQLWLITDGPELKSTIVTEIQPPIIRILLLGGEDADEWMDHLINVVGRFGAQHGCEHIEAVGRAGWRRHAHRLGFKHIYTIYRKEIAHGRQEQNSTIHHADDESGTASVASPVHQTGTVRS